MARLGRRARSGRLGREFQRELLPVGVGVDVQDMAVLDEAVDQRADARGPREEGAPLLEGQIRGDDGGASQVPTGDDVVQDVGRAVVTGQIAYLVTDEQLRFGVAGELALN